MAWKTCGNCDTGMLEDDGEWACPNPNCAEYMCWTDFSMPLPPEAYMECDEGITPRDPHGEDYLPSDWYYRNYEGYKPPYEDEG